MGRTLKRVPLDFEWPMNKVWEGYITPEDLVPPQCRDCHGDGYSTEARAIAETFYPHQIGGPNAEMLAWHDKIGQAEVDNLIERGRLGTLVEREPTEDNPRNWEWQALPRTAAEVNEAQRARGFDLHHDALNRGILVEFRCKMLGIPHLCPTCEGHGSIATPEERETYENWEGYEPPEGPGYQLWETTSEGSPISPVFETLEELCAYAEANCSVFGGQMTSAERWREMLEEDFVRAEYQAADGTHILMI